MAARILGSAVLLALIWGCTHTLKVPTVLFDDYQGGEKINLPVELRLTEKLENAASERTYGLEKVVIPLGNHLTLNAEKLLRVIFTDVSVSKRDRAPGGARPKLIVTPRLVSSARVSPTSIFVQQTLKIAAILEWEIKDQHENLIWIDTIAGEGSLSEPSFSPEENRQKLIESLIRNLFSKSHKAIYFSPEIRNFAAARTVRSKND